MSDRPGLRGRAAPALLAVCALSAMLLSLGCKQEEEFSNLSPEEVAVAEAYIAELDALSAALSSIGDEADAREAVSEIETIVAKIGDLDAQINGLPRKSLRAVRQHFSGRFAFAKRKINQEAVRVLSKPATGKALRDPLTPVAQYVR